MFKGLCLPCPGQNRLERAESIGLQGGIAVQDTFFVIDGPVVGIPGASIYAGPEGGIENVAVVVLSQLSREPDKRKDHTPLMSDLRESGSIEQDADVIMMLYRPAAYPDTQEAMDGDNTSYINVAKHRNGATASIKVMWVPELTKYANYAPDPD